uniref:Enoyl reductase (ER) domain-containing protein n=1 Tax=Noctiluca scintillans TaxID=2966 RepID=A0A7S1F9C0_NOCSC
MRDVTAGQVRVRVEAAAINPVDYKKPTIPVASRWLASDGAVVGIDVSGTIEEVGVAVTGFDVGDAVFGFASGSLAQYAICDSGKIAHKPHALSHVDAATLPTAAVTGYQGLRDNGLKAGDQLLVLGASGGCGLAGVAIGKAMGAVVTGVCSSRNEAVVVSAGADRVVDYTKPETLASLRDFDMVYDTVTGSGTPSDPNYELQLRAALKAEKPYVALNAGASDWLRVLLSKITGLRRRLQRPFYDLVLTDQNGTDLEVLGKWAADGRLRLPVDKTFIFDAPSVTEAFDRLHSRRTVGKLVFVMAT